MNKTNSTQVRLTRQQIWCDADKLAQIKVIPGVISKPAPRDSHIIIYAESAEIEQKIKTILEVKRG